MKTLFTLVGLCLFSTNLLAQDACRPYVPMEVGASWELTSYNPKGKQEGRIQYELVDKKEENGGVTFSVKSVLYDKSDKATFENTFYAYCTDGVFKYDMSFLMQGGQMEAFSQMDVSVDASDFVLPEPGTSPGTILPDSEMTVKAVTDGPVALQMTLKVTDRKVEDGEQVTVPAGTYECMVLSQRVATRMMIKVESSSKEWYAEGIGVVRSESYNKKGKLMGYAELTRFDPS